MNDGVENNVVFVRYCCSCGHTKQRQQLKNRARQLLEHGGGEFTFTLLFPLQHKGGEFTVILLFPLQHEGGEFTVTLLFPLEHGEGEFTVTLLFH